MGNPSQTQSQSSINDLNVSVLPNRPDLPGQPGECIDRHLGPTPDPRVDPDRVLRRGGPERYFEPEGCRTVEPKFPLVGCSHKVPGVRLRRPEKYWIGVVRVL